MHRPRKTKTRWVHAVGCVLVAMVLAASCATGRQSLSDAAIELIEGDFADQHGIELTDASCTDPANDDVGTTFPCEADLDGRPVTFDVLIDAEDHILARSTNLLLVDAQRSIGDAIAATFAEQGVTGLKGEDLDCGGQPIALGNEPALLCSLAVPPDGEEYNTAIRITDLENLVFDFEVADTPRDT